MKLLKPTLAALVVVASSIFVPQEVVALEDGDTVRIVIPYRPAVAMTPKVASLHHMSKLLCAKRGFPMSML